MVMPGQHIEDVDTRRISLVRNVKTRRGYTANGSPRRPRGGERASLPPGRLASPRGSWRRFELHSAILHVSPAEFEAMFTVRKAASSNRP
jgi:hypothetical protein